MKFWSLFWSLMGGALGLLIISVFCLAIYLLSLFGLLSLFSYLGVDNIDKWFLSRTFFELVAAFYPACILSRFAMRYFPVNLSGRFNWSQKISAIPVMIFLGLATFSFAKHLFNGVNSSFVGLVILIVATRLLTDKRRIKKGFVLFLRRFSMFADRSLVNVVYRAIPGNIPLVMLVGSPDGKWWHYDPLQFLFGGWRYLRSPISSGPIYITCNDDNWKTNVGELLDNASLVVMDLSEPSLAIGAEMNLVEERKAESKVLWLLDSRRFNSTRFPNCLVGETGVDTSRLLKFDYGYFVTTVRTVVVFLVFMATIGFNSSFTQFFVMLYLGADAAVLLERSMVNPDEAFGRVLGELFLYGGLFLSMFAKRLPSVKSVFTIKRRIREEVRQRKIDLPNN